MFGNVSYTIITNGNDSYGTEPPSSNAFWTFNKAYYPYHGYLSLLVCAFGLPANLANIIILTRKNMISATNMILMWLAVADLLTMCSYVPVAMRYYIFADKDLRLPDSYSKRWTEMLLFHSSFAIICHTVSIWLTIVLALFRYIYICFPAEGGQICSIEHAKIAIASVYVSTVVICVPNILVNGIKEKVLNNSLVANSTRIKYTIEYSELAEKTVPAIININLWVQAILVKLLPCFMLTILTILLILAMSRANKRRLMLKNQGRKEDSDRAREHNRTTGMLLAIVFFFLLTEMPQGVLTLITLSMESFYHEVYLPLGDLLDIVALINNAVNFVLYCTMSRQFRETFVRVFCGCCPEGRPGWLKLRTFEQKNVINDATASTSSSIV